MSAPVISLRDVREMALALPHAGEEEHWGNPSFRVRGRIFATVPDARHLNAMIDPFEVDAAVREDPDACSQLWWGKEVRGVRVDLDRASRALVGDLLEAAWRRKAPRRVLAAAPERQGRRRHGDRKGTTARRGDD
jgi:hypothetical protein